MAEIEQTSNPQLKEAIGADFKQFPFLKQEQAAKEKASQSKIESELLQKSVEAKTKREALEKISSEDKAFAEAVDKQQIEPPEFKPTQDNAMDLGALFSVVATMGVALGGTGKLSAMNSLNAMGGMLKGWQSGRKDLFAKEQTIFDKETARIKTINDRLIKKLEQYQKLRVTDKEAALLMAQEISSEHPGVIASLIQSGQDSVVAEMAKRNSDMIIKMQELAAKHNVGGQGALPKDAKTKQDYQVKYLSSKNIDEILTLLEDPQISKFITPATKFTPDFIQNLRQRFPELGPKLARVQAIEFETGGKSLTKNEREILEPIYGWKGLTAEALKTRLTESKRTLDNNLALNEVTYPGFKQIREGFEKAYITTGGVPPTDANKPIDIDTERSKAKAAIAKGAPEEKVRSMFKEQTGQEL
jgi:hypothetical protein